MPKRDKKADQIDPRAIRRQHKWALGHDPSDDDAHPDSGWRYIRWEVSEGPETVPDQTKGLGGGPDAFPCDRCQTVMQIVAKKKPSEIIKGSEVIRLKADADLSAVDTDDIFLVACSGCKQTVQMPGTHVRRLRQLKLGRPL